MASTQPEREPLLRRVPSALVVPPVIAQPGIEKLDETVTMPGDAFFPLPAFTTARIDDDHDGDKEKKKTIPQCIAHRGYKAEFPENTLLAFERAVEAGARGLEMDVHVTKDDVVVISHDATLKRCFGRPDKIADRTWDEIKDLRTTQAPHVPMPRLVDVLELLARPGMEKIWILLDIKLDNDADWIMPQLGAVLASAAGPRWHERVVLGIWAAKYLPLAHEHLRGFPVMHIGLSTSYARRFFSIPDVGFNMSFPFLVAPGGRRFLHEAQHVHHRPVLAWTVNTAERMEWCIRRHLDGVLTDDPALYRRVSAQFDADAPPPLLALTARGYLHVLWTWAWISVAAAVFLRKKLMPFASPELLRKEATAPAKKSL